MQIIRHRLAAGALSFMLLGVAPPAAAQGAGAFPTRPVTIIVPFAPGGAVDLECRMYSPGLSAALGQSTVIDYKPGAGTTLGAAQVAKSRPDGHTVLANSTGLTVAPAFYKDLSYDLQKDLAPITLMSKQHSMISVSTSFPAKTLVEYLAYARANPGKINYGTAGAGAISHLAGAWMHTLSNTQVTFIHHKGTGPLLLELQAGRVDVGTGLLIATVPLVNAGKIRPLAVMGAERSNQLPNLPTVAEQGVPGYDYSSWIGFLTTGGTPAAVVSRLNDAFVKTVKSPAIVAQLEKQGSLAVGSSPEQFRQHIAAELVRWKKVVTDANLKLEE